LKPLCEKIASRGFGRVRAGATDNGFVVFAEKWRWTRFGVYIVHLSIILLLVGGLIGSFFGFEGYVNIPEGQATDQIQLRNSGRMMRLDFAIRCNDFDVSFYDTGAPKEFRSNLSLIKDGKTVYQKDIIVNDPLRYGGINIFQSSYGELPHAGPAAGMSPPEEVTLILTSAETGISYEETVSIGKAIQLPEERGTLVLETYNPSAKFRGQDIGEALMGKITPKNGAPTPLLLPIHFPNFDKMRRGGLVVSIAAQTAQKFAGHGGNAAETRYYTGLQVTRDPGVWVVYTGFVLMIIGCFITFFMSHQQLCIEVAPKGKGSRIMVAGISNRNRIAMQNNIKQIVKALSASGGK
jgi:cytochrome c biogenesis protein